MAFVCTSQRKTTQVGENGLFPSPAHYKLQTKSITQQCAPFHTTSIRAPEFIQKVKNQTPGPGEYNISKRLVEPNVSSYVCLNNVVFKINSIGSPSFKSESKRFQESIETCPGPTQYDVSRDSLSVKKPHKMLSKHRIISNVSLEPSIPSRGRGLLNLLERSKLANEQNPPGPGSYQQKKLTHINSRGTVWAKDKIKRFTIDKQAVVGPGKYPVDSVLQNSEITHENAAFKSNTVRTFFDSIMYGSKVQQIVKARRQKNYKSPLPSPGSYNYVSSFNNSKYVPAEFQFFGSSVERFSQQPGLSEEIPFYEVRNSIEDQVESIKEKLPFNSQTKRDSSFLSTKSREDIPGPGAYLKLTQPKKSKSGLNIQSFGSTSSRAFNVPEDNSVGPGQYNINTIEQKVQKRSKTRVGQPNGQNVPFNSKSTRNCFFNSKSLSKIGQYDLSYNDIASKLDRQKFYIQTLRRINVIKPPFESNSLRFPSQKDRSISSENPEKQRLPVIKKQREVQMQKILPGASFGKSQRFRKRKGDDSPGAGTYENPDKWNLNTFNRRFQEY